MTIPDNQAVVALLRMKEHIDRLERARQEPIAIVGFGARTPFEALGVSIWEGLSKGLDASREVPPERWDADAFYDADQQAPNKAVTKRASFLSDVAHFDASFFAIAPVEAHMMDPHQRIVLETAWEAIADAGLSLDVVRKMRTGVFLGSNANDYAMLSSAAELPEGGVAYVATGNTGSVIAGRVSYVLGLTGPCLVVDTACSSSLVAVHLACESLRLRTSDAALAGGVNLMLSPKTTTMLSKLGALSTDGRCRTFDAKGTGYGRGEGCGIVVLKRLSDAVRDGDRVLAVVRGSAVNQDGHSDGLTAPNGLAQQQVIRTALEFAKVSPGDVQYVEAHGTGTVLGDPIEVDALGEVFGAAHTASPLMIGSVKSNIGHLEAAAGMSALLKVILSIQRRELPPSLHCTTPNPHIPWEHLALRVQTKLGPWPEPDKPLVAGVSSFGFSGTNAHVVVSEPPHEAAEAWKEADRLAAEAQRLPLCVSAKTPDALRAYAKRFAEYLSSPLLASTTWRDVAFTSSLRQTHLEHRLVVVGANPAEWREKLVSFANGETRRGLVVGEANDQRTKVVFVFPGQGSQWLGMGKTLLESSAVFRQHVERCEQAVKPYLESSLREELVADAATSRMKEIDVVQPMIFAIQTGLAAMWASAGVVPDVVLGHSMGEVAAAFVAGALTLEDAVRVICIRSKLLRRVRGRGAMAAIEMSMPQAEAALAKYGGKISVAASNGTQSTVVAGDTEAIAALLEELKQRDVFCRPVKADVASHCHQVDELKDDLLRELSGLRPTEPTRRFVSTCVVDPNGKPRLDAAYWWSNLREPVRFSQRASELIRAGHELFVELSPHPVLTMGLDELLRAAEIRSTAVASLRREEPEADVMLEALGALHAAGYPVDWTKIFTVPGRVASLPSYPWQRERYWLPTPRTPKGGRSDSPWALIQTYVASSDQPGKHLFDVELDPTDGAHAYLSDHKVNGEVSLPGTAFGEMALEAAAVAFEGRLALVEGLALSAPLVFAERAATLVQLVFQPEEDGASAFRIASRLAKKGTSAWREHASGRLVLDRADVAKVAGAPLGELQKCCGREVVVSELYDDFEDARISYGASFRAIERAWVGDGEALAKLAAIDELTEHGRGYVLHPLVLEAALQTVAAAMPASSLRRTQVLSTLGSLHVVGSKAPRWAHVTLRSVTDEAVESDVRLLDDEGSVVAEVRALRSTPSGRGGLRDRLFEVVWRTSTPNAAASAEGRWLLLADEQGVASALRRWLEARGASVVTVARSTGFTKEDATHYALDPLEPDALVRVMKEAFCKAPPQRVVHLWSLDIRQPDAPLTEDAVRRAIELGCVSGLHLVHAIAKSGWREAPRLFLVTRGCQAAVSSRDVAMPEQALLWGYGATLEHEMQDLRTTLIDLDAAEIAHEAFATELTRADDERRVALRAGERRVARLVRAAADVTTQAHLDPDLTYLVTEGRGGMGLAMVERLSEMGAKHLALFGRSPPGGATHAALERLARSGAHVDVVDVDIDDRGALERALVELERTKKPLAGVFHAVGVDDDGALSGLSAARIGTALAPSVLGAVWLDQLTSVSGLFVLCSSASSALVSAGHSNDTAASAFFDAFSHYHRARSAGHALSIHWGPTLGSAPVSEEAELLGRVLASSSAQIAAFDFRQWRQANSHLTRMPLLQDLISARKAGPSTEPVAVQALLRELLKQFTSHPKVTDDSNLLDGSMDSLSVVSFLRAVEKSFGLRNLTSRVRARFTLSLHGLTTVIVALASGQEASLDARQASVVVLPDPARRPRETNPARCYPGMPGAEGLRSNVWESDTGLSLEVLQQGNGPCLLLLPPFGCETPVWTPFLQHFQTTHCIVTPNLPGYGRSPLPAPEELSLEAIASALLAILDVIDPTHPIDVVGWSIGGFLTQLLAAAVPTRFRTMTLVNTTAHLGLSSFEDYEKSVLGLSEDLRRDLTLTDRPAELDRLANWGKESRPTGVVMMYSGLIQAFDARPTASAIKTPTLIVAGERDILTPVSMAVALHESIAGSRLEVIPTVGHYAPLVRPEEFARLLTRHLAADRSSS